MSFQLGAFARLRFARLAAITLGAFVLGILSGCASHYVDGTTRDMKAQIQRPATPSPVQLLFQFETKGVANSRATEHLKKQIVEEVKASGLFSLVEDAPVAGGALLDVKLNNVPVGDDAFSKGFVTGLTFGLAGSQVSDGYICTVRYMPAGGLPIVKVARHAIHTTMGAAASPGNAKKAATINEAVASMTQQILSTALNELSHDPDFNK